MNVDHKNIVYIGYAPLTIKTSRDFFVDDLIKAGENVEYWDFTQYYFNDLEIKDSMNEPWIRKVKSMKEFKQLLALKDNDDTIYFVNFPFTAKVIWLFRILTKKKVTMCIIARGMLPIPASTVAKSIRRLFQPGMLRKALNFAFNKIAYIAKSAGFIKPFDRIYYAGAAAIQIAGIGYEKDKSTAQLIPINSADYDSYLSVNNVGRVVPDKYVVFLDEYLPYHPDVYMFGLQTVNADDYYKLLNNFFNEIEAKFNFKVVIAAHPKAERYRESNFFDHREVFFYKTAELIKHSEFVLAHSSTSISFAVLFNKKLLFMYTDYMKDKMGYYFHGIYHFSKALDSALINISERLNVSETILTYNESKYNEFKYGFLTSEETEGHMASEIFIKNIKL